MPCQDNGGEILTSPPLVYHSKPFADSSPVAQNEEVKLQARLVLGERVTENAQYLWGSTIVHLDSLQICINNRINYEYGKFDSLGCNHFLYPSFCYFAD